MSCVLLGFLAVASARPHAMRGVEPTREDLLAEVQLLREEIAALRAGQRSGGRALSFEKTGDEDVYSSLAVTSSEEKEEVWKQ